jgi:hypothetical protein
LRKIKAGLKHGNFWVLRLWLLGIYVRPSLHACNIRLFPSSCTVKIKKKTCLSWLLESKKQSLAALFREHEHLERWPE